MAETKKTKYNLQITFIHLGTQKHIVEQQKDLPLDKAQSDIDMICVEHEAGNVQLQNIIIAPVL